MITVIIIQVLHLYDKSIKINKSKCYNIINESIGKIKNNKLTNIINVLQGDSIMSIVQLI